MSEKYPYRVAPFLLLTFALASCGGGSSDSEPAVGNASTDSGNTTDSSGGNSTGTTGSSISGRVADGYIQGAVVCVDINGNEACDEGEAAVTTGEGGRYALTLPAEAEGIAIVAVIPAAAIDEDTGEPVGQDLVFATPADRPEFISPITTLIHEELRNNPTLDVNAAETSVRSALGLVSDGDDVSLFVDYVASSREGNGVDAERAEDFQYVHQTARVVANLMQDIRRNVEASATESGVDVSGDPATQQAIREIVRSEVRLLLPDIAREVSVLIAEESAPTGEPTSGSDQPAIDHEQIAENLFPEDRLEDVDERIEVIRDSEEFAAADMQRILTEGLYWIDVDCRSFETGPDGDMSVDIEPETTDPSANDIEPMAPLANDCMSEYDHAVLDASGENLEHEKFVYDPEQGIWVAVEQPEDEPAESLALINGEWMPVSEVGPAGAVSFTANGGATITSEHGSLNVHASTLDLGGSRVTHHLWQQDLHPALLMHTSEDMLFESEAQSHILGIQQRSPGIRLFIHPSHDSEADSNCSEFGDNCNVVHSIDESGFMPLTSLDRLREASVNGVDIVQPGHNGPGEGTTVLSLSAATTTTTDQSLPVEGSVLWNIAFRPIFSSLPDCPMPVGGPADGTVPDGDPAVGSVPDGDSTDDTRPDSEQVDGQMPGGVVPGCRPPDGELPFDDQMADPDMPVERVPDIELSSMWRMVETDGVTMLEIEIPLAARHELGLDVAESVLLIEHSGFVRRGARFAEEQVKSAITYNNAAFGALQTIVEGFHSNN